MKLGDKVKIQTEQLAAIMEDFIIPKDTIFKIITIDPEWGLLLEAKKRVYYKSSLGTFHYKGNKKAKRNHCIWISEYSVEELNFEDIIKEKLECLK